METMKNRFGKYNPWKKVGFVIYGLIGLVFLIALVWAIVLFSKGTFYAKVGFFKMIGFFFLELGGLILLTKFVFGKDMFGN